MVEAGLQAVPIVNKSKFEKMIVPIPSDEKEQKDICETLTSIDKKIESENLYLNKLYKVKQALMQDLLTGKVRVKVEEDGDE
jgi:type I restriction enzyme S subunit